MLNCYEETSIRNSRLPVEWQSQSALDELSQFLQMNWEQRSVFYDDGDVSSRQQFLSFTGQKGIRTTHYIGTIAFKEHQLNIFPKMFRSDKDDNDTQDLALPHLMKNLVQWIEYCNRFEYPYISIKSDFEDTNDLRELFISLYIRYVKSALDRSLFYQYEDRDEDCASIKGKFDVRDYLCSKLPSGNAGNFRCTYSSFVADNRLNQIIKYTCKLLNNEASRANQGLLRHILTKLNDVSDSICKPADCNNIRLSRLQSNYRVILSMSKMFLLNQTSSYDININESFCFLFPTEYLFEGFIGGFMQAALTDSARVRLQASEVALVDDIIIAEQSYGKAFTMRHDILVEHQNKGLFIFDTKYKGISRIRNNEHGYQNLAKQAHQPDLYQMFTYAVKRNLNDIYLLYPMYRFENEEDDIVELVVNHPVAGSIRRLTVHIVRLPFIFEDDIELVKSRLATVISNIFY